MKRSIQILRLFWSVCLLLPFLVKAGDSTRLKAFSIEDVHLLPGIFTEAEQTDLAYIMQMDPDRLLAPFLREAGLATKAPNYPNWENTGLDGHIAGHYLTALSLMYASTHDKKVLDRLQYMLNELKRTQVANGNGYIGGVPGSKAFWTDVAAGKFVANSFDINKKWVPLYNIHKTYAGLRDAWLYAHSQLAKDMLIGFTDWMMNETSRLSDEQVQQLLRSEHGGLNEVFADVADITGEKKYLDLARKFSQKTLLQPLSKKEDKLNNMHANTQIPKVIGYERIAAIDGDSLYHTAAQFFWQTVVNNRTVAIGGNSVREHFNPANDFSSMITSEQGPETCNTYNMLKLTKELYESSGRESYIDYYEKALYNHILSTQHPRGGFVYFTPMRPGHYRVYSQPQTSFWCCVGSGLENHAKYGEIIYAHNDNDIYVNLFIPSTLTWKAKGIQLSQHTRFPDEERTTIEIISTHNKPYSIHIRYPIWVATGKMHVAVNGSVMAINASPGTYVPVTRSWKKGDKITIQLPMNTATEALPDGSDYVAVLHGPIVLAAKIDTDTAGMPGLFADSSRMGHVAQGKQLPLQSMPVFLNNGVDIASQIKPVPGKPLTFSAKSLIYPTNYQSLELIPFYRLHDARYVIYWRKVTAEKLQEMEQQTAREEAAKQELAANTLDLIYPGEQQPESDHFVESENSNTGVNGNRHWRDATGWFSYKMKQPTTQPVVLRVTYFGGDKGRRFKIFANDQLVAKVTLDVEYGNDFYTVDYEIPAGITSNNRNGLRIKFVADEGSVAGGIYELRLLKK